MADSNEQRVVAVMSRRRFMRPAEIADKSDVPLSDVAQILRKLWPSKVEYDASNMYRLK